VNTGKYGGMTCTVQYNKNDDYATNPIITSYKNSGRFSNDPEPPTGKPNALDGTEVDPDSPWKADTNPDTV